MIADRVYSVGVEEQSARSELLRCAGRQFDSRVVAAFLSVLSAVDAAGSVHDVEVA
jgi:HD-GYP domain-containing protein (c-di-GMP phosphodiesterase class II)